MSGNADIVSWGGAIEQPVFAGSIRRLIATGGEYIAAFSDSYVEAASQRFGGSQEPLEAEIETGTVVAAEIGWVSWTVLGNAELVRWKAPIIGTSLINSVLVNGSLENVITSGGNINCVRADLELKSTIQAVGTIGFGEVLPDYSRSIPEYWVSSRTVYGGSVNSLISAGSHINNVRSTAGDIESIIQAGGNIGVVNAEGGKVDSYIGALGRINQVAATGGIDGVISALLSIGQVWTQASITATVSAGTGINTVEAWNNISGSIRALAGPIRLVSAGTKDSYGHVATGGSISSSVIYAGKSIGSVIARKVISTQGVAPGGNIQVAGGITAGGGYVGQVSAGDSVAATVTAVDDIGSVVAGNSISGTVESQHGAVLIVTATTGAIFGQVKAKLNVGDVTAGTDRIGETKAETGSIGNIKATLGKIDGEINGLKGIGNITAGTSILKSITTAGAGASIGHIRAGAATTGNILGAITANGNILSVVATAVKEEELPNALTSTFDWAIRLGVDGTYTKPERMKLNIPKVYTDGNIGGTIYAGGGIFDVTAHGRISKDIHADGELPKVLAFKNITADLTVGKGGSNVTTYGELRGDVTIPGNTTVWAYDDVSGNLQIAEGTLNVTTWGSFISESNATGHQGVTVQAYNAVNGSEIKSDAGTTSVSGLDGVHGNISGYLHAIVNSGADVSGSVSTDTRDTFLRAIKDWGAAVDSHGRNMAQIGKALRSVIKARDKNHTIVESVKTDGGADGSDVFLFVLYDIGDKTVNTAGSDDTLGPSTSIPIKATNGSVHVEAQNIYGAKITAASGDEMNYGAVVADVFGHFKNSQITSKWHSIVYASGTISNLHVVASDVDVTGIRGVNGMFRAKGLISVISWDGITGTLKSSAGSVRVAGYGDLFADIKALHDINASIWGNVNGSEDKTIQSNGNGVITIFARQNVSAAITASGPVKRKVEVIAGGKITGDVKTSRDPDPNVVEYPSLSAMRGVTLRALGEITGDVSADGDVFLYGLRVAGTYESIPTRVAIHAIEDVDARVNAGTNITIAAGTLITSTTAADPAHPDQPVLGATTGTITLTTPGTIKSVSVSAGAGITAVAGGNIEAFHGTAGEQSVISSFGTISNSSLTAADGNITAFAGDSAAINLTAHQGNVTAISVNDMSGTFAGAGDITVVAYGYASNVTAEGDNIVVFGLRHAGVSLHGRATAAAESAYGITGTVDASIATVIAGHASAATVNSGKSSTVVAGHAVSGTVSSNGTATVVSKSRGAVIGDISAVVKGKQGTTVVSLGGTLSGHIESEFGFVEAFAGVSITSPVVKGKTQVRAIAITDISGGTVESNGPARAYAFGTISSQVTSESATAVVIAGDNVAGNVTASKTALVGAVSGVVSGTVTSTSGSTIVLAMDGISGTVTAHRHAIALSYASITATVTANNGTALVVSVAGGVTKDVSAGQYAVVIAFNDVTGKVDADKSILIATLGSVTKDVDAGEYAVVLAAGEVKGASITAGKSALVVAFGNVDSSVTAEDGSLLILTLGNVTSTLSATEFVVVVAAGNIKISVPESQDLIVISGGETEYKFQTTQQEADAAAAFAGSGNAPPAASASRDLVLFGLGGVKGTVHSGRDAVLVSMGTSTANVSAGGDAVLFAFNGIQRTSQNLIPTLTGGGDAILISGSSGVAHVIGGKNAILTALGSVSGATVSGSEFAGVMTFGSGLDLLVSGPDGAFAWTYGDFSGSIISSAGSAVLMAIGNAHNAVVHGKENAVAVTVGSFSGTVTADEDYAGIISLLNAEGTLSAGKGAVLISDGAINVEAIADADILVWARGNVSGTFHAGRDAAVVSHGNYDATLTADRDIVFAYAGTSLRGSLTAGRWIGDGSTSPPGDPAEIDDVFSHGDILAQILAGTSASNDPDKGRIGTIGSIGNAGGTFAAQHINRIRTAGLMTASLQTSTASFAATDDGSGPSTGTGTTIVTQNLSTLATDVPKPVLDPSERSQILADSAADKATILAERGVTSQAIVDQREAVQEDRTTARNDMAEERNEQEAAADILQRLVDIAVNAAQYVAQQSLKSQREEIERTYLAELQEFLRQQSSYSQLRDSLKKQMTEIQTRIREHHQQLVAAFVSADRNALVQQQDVIDAQQDLLEDHDLRWGRAYVSNKLEDAAAFERFRESIHSGLDWLGFAPGVGAFPDLLNAVIYFVELDFGTAFLSVAAAVPALGDGFKASTMAAKAASSADNAARTIDSGFGFLNLYRAPTTIGDKAVEAAFKAEVESIPFRVQLIIHNLLTPGRKWISPAMIRAKIADADFGLGWFTVKPDEVGKLLFGGQGVRTFLNRQFFRHELIHVSQILKNPNLWSTPGWRAVHEPVQLLTAHWWIGWPAIIYFRDDIIVTTEWFIGIFGNEGE